MSQELVTISDTISIPVAHRDGKTVVASLPRYADQDAPFVQLWPPNQRAYKG